jgi:hypothetical protein
MQTLVPQFYLPTQSALKDDLRRRDLHPRLKVDGVENGSRQTMKVVMGQVVASARSVVSRGIIHRRVQTGSDGEV